MIKDKLNETEILNMLNPEKQIQKLKSSASPLSSISYTNPASRMSVFRTSFWDIYNTEYPQGHIWASINFYLPVASYVNTGVSGTIIAEQ